MKHYKKYLLLFSLVFFTDLSSATESIKNELKLQGTAEMTWFIFDVYTARLYTNNQKDIYSDQVYLELTYKRDLSGNSIADRSVSEMIDGGVEEKVAESYRGLMKSIFPDVSSGTVLSAHFVPGKGISFFKNGDKKIGFDKRDTFAKHFLDIWLGVKTSEPELRKKLLGG